MKPAFAFCAGLLSGLCVSAAGMLCAAGLLTVIDLPTAVYRWLAVLPLLCGAYLSGRTTARRLRRHGLCVGAAAALLLTGCWYILCCLLAGKLLLPVLFCLTLPCGSCGGVRGAAMRAPKSLPVPHRLQEWRVRTALRRQLLHRPPKAE